MKSVRSKLRFSLTVCNGNKIKSKKAELWVQFAQDDMLSANVLKFLLGIGITCVCYSPVGAPSPRPRVLFRGAGVFCCPGRTSVGWREALCGLMLCHRLQRPKQHAQSGHYHKLWVCARTCSHTTFCSYWFVTPHVFIDVLCFAFWLQLPDRQQQGGQQLPVPDERWQCVKVLCGLIFLPSCLTSKLKTSPTTS